MTGQTHKKCVPTRAVGDKFPSASLSDGLGSKALDRKLSPSVQDIKVTRLRISDSDFDKKFRTSREFLISHFDVEVVTPEETMREYLRLGAYVFMRAENSTGETVGAYIASVHATKVGTMVYIHYMVVDEKYRKQGLNTLMETKTLEAANKYARSTRLSGVRYITGEVEPPASGSDAGKLAALFAMDKSGFRVASGFQYYQPPFEAKDKPIPMALIIKDVEDVARTRISAREVYYLSVALYTLYTEWAHVPDSITRNLSKNALGQLASIEINHVPKDSGEIDQLLARVGDLKLIAPGQSFQPTELIRM